MATAVQERKPAVKLDSVFLTGPGDLLYEVPKDVATKYVMSPERLKELGHLPIEPYSTIGKKRDKPATSGAEEGGGDVEGRHLAWNPYLGWVWHSNVLFGTALAVNGFYYTGYHYHPYGTELAYFE